MRGFGFVLLGVVACASPARPGPIVPVRQACLVAPAGVASAESISVATSLTIDPAHVGQPANGAERFVFAQLYETLINLDCEGKVYAGLARSWTTDDTRTRVSFVLRDDARFNGGAPVTANDVVAAWRTTGQSSGEDASLARRLADATTIADYRTLTVSLTDTSWRALALPAFAVYRASSGAGWPEGSGAFRIGESVSGRVSLVGASTTLVIGARRGDARDAIDAGADLVLSADPIAVSYAAARPTLPSAPLPWTRTYALAAPNGATLGLVSSNADSASAFRSSLARDVVRVEARPADRPQWFNAGRCESGASPGNATTRSQRIVYTSGDRVAAALAERLVAVSRRATAAALAPADFARALRAGNELAYVLALPHASLAPCRDWTALLASAPWLVAPDALVPLIDTRERAIVNRDRVAATIDWDGTLRMRGRP